MAQPSASSRALRKRDTEGPDYYSSPTQSPLSLRLFEGFSGRVIETVQSDAAGKFRFPVDVPSGIYYIELRSSVVSGTYDEEHVGTFPIEIDAAAAQDGIDIDFGWSDCGLHYQPKVIMPDLTVNKICGDITDTGGRFAERVQLLLLAEGGQTKFLEQALSGPNGEFALKEQREGTYQLILRPRGMGLPILREIHLVSPSFVEGCQQPVHLKIE
jgi:hypothetical protein